ncbi:MAG TPA: DUF305 domain-containing protein [Longimicrobium sp.]|nr:DUF305 domain-containing protein [Longimicrobium sp.]
MTRLQTRLAAALLAAATLAACGGAPAAGAQTTPAPAGGHHHPAAQPAAGTLPPGAHHPWTEADVRFMSNMIGHHAQAIEMSRLAPERAGGNNIRILAERIIAAQEDEIATMQQWLRDRGEPVPDVHAGHHAGHGALMPGMATPEQMARLAAARGPAFDLLFLNLMIHHHQGAVGMVSELFSSYGAGQDETVFKFASDVNVDQATEIARMQKMLEGLMFASPTP